MNRRQFLKLSALGLGTLALEQIRWSLGQEAGSPAQDLIVVSNAGNPAQGAGPSVSLINPSTLALIATLPLAGSYSLPATRWSFTRDLIWSSGTGQNVVAYRLSSGERALELATGSGQNYTEVTPDGRYLINAARFADKIQKISADPDAADFGEVVAELDTYQGASPCDVTVSADGSYAYTPDRGGDTLTTIDLQRFTQASVTPLERFGEAPLEPYMATVSPTSNVLFVENATVEGGSPTGSESIFDLADPANPVEVARLSAEDGLGAGPITSEFTLDGRYGLVVCRNSSELSIIDTSSLKVVASVPFPAGSNPLTGTFVYGGDGGDTFFVPLPGRDAVAAVRLPAFEVAELIPVGPQPLGVVYLRAPVPARDQLSLPVGAALASGRTFSPDCHHRCCGAL